MKKKVDFTGVETFLTAPEGTHKAKVKTMEEVTFQSGSEGFKVAFEITAGAGKGALVYNNYPLTDKALWKLKSLLQALGMKADGRTLIDTDKIEGKSLEIDVTHEEYDGKTRARVNDMRKLGSKVEEPEDDDFDEDEEEAEEDTKKSKKASKTSKKTTSKTKKKPEPEEEPEDDDDDDWDDDDWDDED